MIFRFWGDGSQSAMDAVNRALEHVRDSAYNFNWTFIFILAVVFYVYWSELHKKNYAAVQAGLALYGVHWLYEIMNAIICKASGYPLWTVSPESTTFILLIGVSWELSMMFSLAGIISFKMMPAEKEKRTLSRKLITTASMALLFALFESFLAGAAFGGKPTFIWVYPWWGVIPVFFTTYVPFFLASNFVPDMKPKIRNIFLIAEWGLVALLLIILIPCGVI